MFRLIIGPSSSGPSSPGSSLIITVFRFPTVISLKYVRVQSWLYVALLGLVADCVVVCGPPGARRRKVKSGSAPFCVSGSIAASLETQSLSGG